MNQNAELLDYNLAVREHGGYVECKFTVLMTPSMANEVISIRGRDAKRFFDVMFPENAQASPKNVIFHDHATIVYWNDGAKTVVKCQDGDTFSEEAGIALCFMKKMLGNKGNYNKVLREALEKARRQGE